MEPTGHNWAEPFNWEEITVKLGGDIWKGWCLGGRGSNECVETPLKAQCTETGGARATAVLDDALKHHLALEISTQKYNTMYFSSGFK